MRLFFFTFFFFPILVYGQATSPIQKDTTYLSEPDTVVIYKEPLIIRKKVYVEEHPPKHYWSADVFLSPFICYSLASTTHSQYEPYLRLRKKSEENIPSYSIGTSINLNIKAIRISAGPSITIFNNKLNYTIRNFSEERHDSLYMLLDEYTEEIDGKTILHQKYGWYDSTYYTYSKEEQKIKNNNRYTYLELPIQLGYTYSKSKISYTIRGGMILGVFIKAKAKAISKDDYTKIETNNTGFAKTTLAYTFGIGLAYHVKENLSLLLEPYYRQDVKSVLSKNDYFNNFRYGAGLRLGTRFYF